MNDLSTAQASDDDRAAAGIRSVYETLRGRIIEGAYPPGARLVASVLAQELGTSTNPVREALRQLSGEGFVTLAHNRGARVRAIDAAFVRDVIEIETLLEPYMTRWFVGVATAEDLAALHALQAEMEANAFADAALHTRLDTEFHRTMYERHYNRHAVDLWWKHREVISAISRRQRFSLDRQKAILREHRALLAAIEAHDAGLAAETILRHIEGSGRHVIDRMGGGIAIRR